ncbi:hypothetical protein [Luteolibacter luteus]|uniref:Uncharacterized protein n=1 Tax=Luteolibacter luteus TaxID=2728835 RepID=A0A858RHB4_9BACT|nr:hypothetical protein [Luteolibacter luteus]QJE96267.1 hypothetical protein HHL09_10885 [Luteolibacter luteus]
MNRGLLAFGFLATLFSPVLVRADLQEALELLPLGSRSTEDWGKILDARIEAGEPLPDLPPPITAPPDEATPQQHLNYWRQREPWAAQEAAPSAIAREKILQAISTEPAAIPEVLPAFPTTEETARQIHELLPRLSATDRYDQDKLRTVRAWIYRHSGLGRDEVIADARKPDWKLYRPDRRPDAPLAAIQSREPEFYAKLLEELALGTNPGLAVAAAELLFLHSPPDARTRWHQQLIAAAANPLLDEKARSIAVEALVDQEWPGREAWILSCLQQPDPGDVHEFGGEIYRRLDHWIPLLTTLIGGENQAARDHAACLLVAPLESFIWQEESDKEDPARIELLQRAARPLLPWLKDPEWAACRDANSRLRLIQSLGGLNLPECVPGLLEVIRKSPDSGEVAYAVQSITPYHSAEALPAAKEALARFDSYDRRMIIAEAHKLGGFSREESIAAVRAFLEASPEAGTGLYHQSPPAEDPSVDIGDHLIFEALPNDAALREILTELSDSLDDGNPELAGRLRNLIVKSSPAPSATLVTRLIEANAINRDALAIALERKHHPGWDGNVFQPLLHGAGLARGLAAVLSNDDDAIGVVLSGQDREAKLAALSAADYAGSSIGTEYLSALLSNEDDALREATEAYVKRSKLPEVMAFRELKMPSWDPATGNYNMFYGTVNRLATQLKITEQPMEVFALLSSIQGMSSTSWLLVVYPSRTIAVKNPGDGSIFTCEVPANQLGQVRSFIQTYRSDDLPDLELPAEDGIQYLYVHTSNTGTKTVSMDNPPESRDGILEWIENEKMSKGIVHYGRLVLLFHDLFEKLPLRPGYREGIDIVIPREKALIKSVWKQGDDLRVLIQNSSGSAHWQALSLTTKELGGPIGEPAESPFLVARADLHPDFKVTSDYHFRYPWQVRSGDATVHTGNFRDIGGLWLCRRGEEPELVVKGTFLWELVSADGKWCVAAKATGDTWADPNVVVRINLETKQELPVLLEKADDLWPVAFFPAHGKFLIRRAGQVAISEEDQSTGPREPEFHLLDASTGDLEKVSGDFQLLLDKSHRPFQAANPNGLLWGADGFRGTGDSKVSIGTFDTRTFRFEPVKKIDGIFFDSQSMWIDAEEGFIYAALNGDLVRIPLR